MVKIYQNTKIYVACPAYVATGGPELLHQLVYHLINDIQVNAFIFYYDYKKDINVDPVNRDYKKYNLPYVTELQHEIDSIENILIVPEILLAMKLLEKYNYIRKSVWFLSVDNYYLSRMKWNDFFFQRIINKFFKVFKKSTNFNIASARNVERLTKKYDYTKNLLLTKCNFFLTQSFFAQCWFDKLPNVFYLSDYINKFFLEKELDVIRNKENIVAYNPSKGYSFTKKIIKSAKDICFVPIRNMTREEVINLLERSKVYIDFGNHPGKDRIPREAAILGCCVITGKRGSAAYFEDVPIPDSYKFSDTKENIPLIVNKIRDCLNNYEERNNDFTYYREYIKNEPNKFIDDLKRIFVKV